MLAHLGLSQANSVAKFVLGASVIFSRGQRGADGSRGQAAMLQLLEEKRWQQFYSTLKCHCSLAALRAKMQGRVLHIGFQDEIN